MFRNWCKGEKWGAREWELTVTDLLCHMQKTVLKGEDFILVGSHNSTSLQHFPKMYYYLLLSITDPHDRNMLLKTTTPCIRWNIFLPIPYPHYILFCLTPPGCVANFCNSVKKNQHYPQNCILLQHFEVTRVTNMLTVNNHSTKN